MMLFIVLWNELWKFAAASRVHAEPWQYHCSRLGKEF